MWGCQFRDWNSPRGSGHSRETSPPWPGADPDGGCAEGTVQGEGLSGDPPTLHCYSALPAPDMPPPPTWALVLRHLPGPPQEGGVLWTSLLAHRLTHSGAGSLWPHAWRLEFRNEPLSSDECLMPGIPPRSALCPRAAPSSRQAHPPAVPLGAGGQEAGGGEPWSSGRGCNPALHGAPGSA